MALALAILLIFVSGPPQTEALAASQPAKPSVQIELFSSDREDEKVVGKPESLQANRLWYALTVANHSAATFDAWSTRRVIRRGSGYEMNPLMRPFAHSSALYPAIQVGPTLLNLIGRKMQQSQNTWARRFWWVPQTVGTIGSFWSGFHNLGVARRQPGQLGSR